MHRVSEDILMFPGQGYDSNTYLLLGKHKVVVDPGTGFHFAEFEQALKQIGLTVQDIDFVVNTHCHFDHAGADHLFSCPTHIHELELLYLHNSDVGFTCAGFFGSTLIPPKDLEVLSSFDGWRVLLTPGHTQGSVCLVKGDYLISGDTLFANGVGRTDLPGGDEHKLQKSLKLLKDLHYEVLLPGHDPLLRKE